MVHAFKAAGKRLLGPKGLVWARCLLRGFPIPRWGNLRRVTPFSAQFGFERGLPVDRFYLHRFLDANREAIRGDVLEVQMVGYTRRFGHDLGRTDSFDVVPTFDPTYLCDLAHCGDVIPTAAYDCVLLPNTPQHLRELEPALRHAYRALRPGGVLLASAAGLLPLTGEVADYWRATPAGWRELAASVWPDATVAVEGHGNCLAVIAAAHGLAFEELSESELLAHDPRFPLLVTIACRRPAENPS
mgnify:CR=1 FL=1